MTLCRTCGLCCDGSLFGWVPLEDGEATVARARLPLVGDGFAQPCTALEGSDASGAARTCAIYADRPRACRRFVCRLYERHCREGGPLAPRLASVRRVRALLDRVRDANVPDGPPIPGAPPEIVDELTRRLDEDFARA